MQINTFKILLLGLFLSLSFVGNANESTEEKSDEKEFNVTDMIMHHIKDAHDFHIMDWDGHAISFPLPVILWTKDGLVTFMSSKFYHNDDGTVVVEKGGQKFVKFHEEIFYANDESEDGSYMSYDAEHHPINSAPLDFSITKLVFSMFMSMMLLMLIFGFSARAYKKSENGVPTGIAKFTEPLVVFIRDEVAIPNIGEKHYKKFLPFLLTLFFFIWINNIMGLIPFFPFSGNLSGNIAFTGVLALITFIITTFVANKDYWKHIFWMPGVPWPMKIILAPIELLGTIIKPFSLMIRLYANITAGHVVLMSIIGLMFIFKNWIGSPLSFGLAFALSLLELLVAALQAYIFTMLSALYFGSAVEEHDHH